MACKSWYIRGKTFDGGIINSPNNLQHKKNNMINVLNNINHTSCIQMLQINEMMHINVLTLKTMEKIIDLSCI